MPDTKDLLAVIEETKDGVNRLAAQFEMTTDRIEEIRRNWLKARSPKTELKWRLNRRLKGQNPGTPVNWRGL